MLLYNITFLKYNYFKIKYLYNELIMKNSTIHTYYSNNPVYKLTHIPKNRGLQFVYNESKTDTIWMALIFVISIVFISVLDEVPPMAILILVAVLGGFYFITKMFKNQMLIFDTQEKLFYKFNKKSKETSDKVPFSQINSIQILHYKEQSSNEDFDTYRDAYELNLVLKNRRVNVITHSDYKSIQKDAQRLGKLLNVQISNDKVY